MRRKMLFACSFFVVMLLVSCSGFAQSSIPQETLQQYVIDLQKNPSDAALREKIINLVSTMSSLPEVPSEAKKHISRGVAAIEGAKNPDDFKDACNEFQQVTMLAPWLGNGYRNLAIAQDKAGMYAAALQSLSLYLLTKPSSADVEWAEDLRNKVEYRKEKSTKESSPEVVAAKKQDTYEEWLNNLDGARFIGPPLDIEGKTMRFVYYIQGNKVYPGWFTEDHADYKTAPIGSTSMSDGHRNVYSLDIRGKQFLIPTPPDGRYYTATISDDGQLITVENAPESFHAPYTRVK